MLPPSYSHHERMARKTHLQRRPEREGKSGHQETSPPALFPPLAKLHHSPVTLSFLIVFMKMAVLENRVRGAALEL